jgi:hypothetical protein
MIRHSVMRTFVLMTLTAALLPNSAIGQQKSIKDQLIGT